MDEDTAFRRYWQMQGTRLISLAAALLGVVIISGRLLDAPALGYVLLVAGAVGFFLLPALLAKRWREPDE